jgi:hypothetical protein
MRQRGVWALFLIGAVLIEGCATFQLTQEPFTPKGRKLAVIAGLTNASSQEAAQAFAGELSTASQFQVMPQKQVAQSIPNYPQLIRGPYNSSYFEIDVNYTRTDLYLVKQLQKNLGTDYVYVLWAPTVTTNGQKSLFSKNYSMMTVIAQLYEFPDGKEVGHGTYMVRIDPDKNQIVLDDLRRVTKELAEKTKMLR